MFNVLGTLGYTRSTVYCRLVTYDIFVSVDFLTHCPLDTFTIMLSLNVPFQRRFICILRFISWTCYKFTENSNMTLTFIPVKRKRHRLKIGDKLHNQRSACKKCV